jgi:hypothetical protein
MTELGRLYGLSSHEVGRLLKAWGLRTASGKPSDLAHTLDLVQMRESQKHATTLFYVWAKEDLEPYFHRNGIKPLPAEPASTENKEVQP